MFVKAKALPARPKCIPKGQQHHRWRPRSQLFWMFWVSFFNDAIVQTMQGVNFKGLQLNMKKILQSVHILRLQKN